MPDSVVRLWWSEAALDREQSANRAAADVDLNNIMKESMGFRRYEEIEKQELIVLA
jgi:hypothetical protein